MYTQEFAALGRGDLTVAGGKGANLGELVRAGFPVPPGFVVVTTAYTSATADLTDQLLAAVPAAEASPTDFERAAATIAGLFERPLPDDIARAIDAAYAELGSPPVAVRSSATAEDLAEASFAGQQETFLNVQGAPAVREAVVACWASLWTARAMQYRARAGVNNAEVQLAVVVQTMAPARASGVMFTADPTSGRRDRSVIAAAWGLGEAIVSGQVDTDNLLVSHDGQVLDRTTADKQVLTALTTDGVETRTADDAQRHTAVLDDGQAVELSALGVRIAEHFGAPQDIEWVLTDAGFGIVQSRPVTTLPPETADPPTEWRVSDRRRMYARASIIEQLPDPLTPLFADLIEPAVLDGLENLFRSFGRLGEIGASTVRRGAITFPVINGYAYYSYSMGLLLRWTAMFPALLPRLALPGPSSAVANWHRTRESYQRTVEDWKHTDVQTLPASRLLDGVHDLLHAGTRYYSSVQAVIPIAATAELTFAAFYRRFVRREGDPPAETFLVGFDSTPIRAERSLAALVPLAGDDAALARGVEQHLERFGHLLYNLDFASATPADDPGFVVDTVRQLAKTGAKVDERQQHSVEERTEATRTVRARLDPARRATFDRLLKAAQRDVPLREDALADVGLGWPTIRRLLAELGRRLVQEGALTDADDVYWLQLDEAQEAARCLDGGHAVLLGDGHEIAQRKAIWRGRRGVLPPGILPEGAWFSKMEKWMPTGSESQTGNVITGIGASAGAVTAPARLIGGPSDFASMQPGEVLVASITTPAYTSLFALASAVVTDVGGPLSHSSIVAREYRIPAVLGTAVATRRIQTGVQITVDGDRGTVTLPDED